MKGKIILVVALISLLVSLPKVNALDWSGTSINSGYAVTTDVHGTPVPLETPVTAWAGTTNLGIMRVIFRWLKPDGSEFVVVPVNWGDPGTSMGVWTDNRGVTHDVREFSNTQIPNIVGDWGVQGVFYDLGGHGQGPIPGEPEKVAIRARSFFAVPEVTFGTIAILIAMLGAFGLFAIRKKRISPLGKPT